MYEFTLYILGCNIIMMMEGEEKQLVEEYKSTNRQLRKQL